MNITNGTVTYGRTTKPADYESKKAEVVLSFEIEEGADAAAATTKVFDMAVAEVHRRLGIATSPTAREGAAEAMKAYARIKAKVPPVEVPEANPTVAPSVGLTEPELSAAIPATAGIVDPAAIEEPADVPEAVIEDKPAAVVTDKDLHAGVHLAMERHVANKAIKDLVVTFTGGVAGKSMTLIPVDDRRAFLAALKAL